ncbi:MAG TPA: VWA domain-containing protein [Terriglobales bacterium]|nr:VWA domain-containing protein [Terriglobales bacterium]
MKYSQIACRPFALFVFLGCALAQTPQTTAAASQVPSNSPPTPTFHTSTRMVTLEVVARDHHGQPVQGLTADDFRVIEQISKHEEHTQKIAAFRAVSVAEIAARDKGRVQLPPGVYTNLVTMDKHPVPPTILLIDGLNTDRVSQAQVHRQMIRMLASIPSDMPVSVFLLGRNLKLIQKFTTDPELLKTALQKAQTVESNQSTEVEPQDDPDALSASAETMEHFPPDSLNAMEQFEREVYATQMDQRVLITLDALRAISRYASGYPGRKNLLWISSSFPVSIDPDVSLGFAGLRNYIDQMSDLGGEFAESKIAIYPMDPAGLQVSSMFQAGSRVRGAGNPQRMGGQLAREDQSRYNRETTMRVLAEDTGGIVCVNDNDLGDCVRKAVNDGSSFYEIAYYPDSGSWSGEYHKIMVKTSKSGVHLAYRRGYYAKSRPTDEKIADRELQEAACRDLLNSTFLLMAAKQIPVDEPGKARYFMEIDPGKLTFTSQSDGARELALKVGVCTFDKSGKPLQFMEQSINPTLSDKQYSAVQANGYPHYVLLTASAGVATVRLVVQDMASGEMGSVNIPYKEMVASAATSSTSGAAPAPPAQTMH